MNTPGMTLLDYTYESLRAEMRNLHESHTRALWRALYREDETSLETRADFLPPLQRWLQQATREVGPPTSVTADLVSSDGYTRKSLLRLADGVEIETVLMGYPGRYTACVSTQAGCAVGCVFCATGQNGFFRQLTAGEIVSQVQHHNRALRAAGEARVRNLVLMGMGEPLLNYDAVMTALTILSDDRGINISPSRITISTVGIVPGIRRMAIENSPYCLAVSLHAATQEERLQLVPLAKKWPLDQLIEACRFYCETTGRRIFFEWTLIEKTNDTPELARKLATLLAGIEAHINLIPLNPTNGYTGVQSSRTLQFQAALRAEGLPCTIRQRRGIDVAAGCGQLAGS